MRQVFLSGLFLAALMVPLLGGAQEGFPLDGTWRGTWQDQSGTEHMVVMVMAWDGRSITGIINPGRNAVPIDRAELALENWFITIEATDKDGKPITAQGILKNIGAYNREVMGTWTIAGESFPFRMVRE